MNIIELKEQKLKAELVEELNAAHGDAWHFVIAKVSEDDIMIWIVQKGDAKYEIVAGEKISTDKYNEEVLK